MKTSSFLTNPPIRIALAILAALVLGHSAQANTLYWGKGGATTNPDNLWTTAANWYTDTGETIVSGAAPTIADDVFFNTTPDNALGGTISITGNAAANSITYNTTANTTLSQSGNRNLVLGSGGITVNSTGNLALGQSTNSLFVEIAADQTWTTNSTGTLSSRRLGASDSATGPVTLTFNAANSGGISTSFGLTDSPDGTKALAVVVDSSGTGTVSLNGGVVSPRNAYTGGTLVKRGILQISSPSGLGTGGVELNSNGTDAVRLNTNSAITNNFTVTGTNTGLAALTGSTGSDFQGTISLSRDVALGSVSSSGQTVIYSGAISGAANVTIGRVATGTSSPTVRLTGSNSYSGKTTIESAIVEVNSLKNVGGGNSSLGAVTTVSNGTISIGLNADSTLRYIGTGDTTDRVVELTANRTITLEQAGTGALIFTGGVTNSGSGSRTLRLRGSTAGTGEISGEITNNGASNLSLSKLDNGTWRLSGSNTYAGGTSFGSSGVEGGVLEVTHLADGGLASSIGLSSNTASNLVFGGTTLGGSTLRYVGAGDSTDRRFTVGSAGAVFDASGSGAVAFTNTAAPDVSPSAGQTRTITLTGTNTGANTMAASFTDSGLGATSISKDGGGKWLLTGTNTYTGNTTVTAGTLLINGSTAAGSAVTVNGGKLGGTGTIGGSVTVNSGGTLSPGASIESLATGSNTWNGGGALDFEFSTDGSTGSAGIEWDLLAITGGLDLSGASSVTPFTFNLFTMADATTAGPLASWDPDVSHTWAGFVTTTTGVTSFASNKFAFNVTGFQNPLTGTFSVVENGNNLDLVYSAIPEPATWALLAFSLTTVVVLRRRRA